MYRKKYWIFHEQSFVSRWAAGVTKRRRPQKFLRNILSLIILLCFRMSFLSLHFSTIKRGKLGLSPSTQQGRQRYTSLSRIKQPPLNFDRPHAHLFYLKCSRAELRRVFVWRIYGELCQDYMMYLMKSEAHMTSRIQLIGTNSVFCVLNFIFTHSNSYMHFNVVRMWILCLNLICKIHCHVGIIFGNWIGFSWKTWNGIALTCQ